MVGVLHLSALLNRAVCISLRMTSNINALTQSYKVIRAKKKQKREQIPAIVFDEDARRYAYI